MAIASGNEFVLAAFVCDCCIAGLLATAVVRRDVGEAARYHELVYHGWA